MAKKKTKKKTVARGKTVVAKSVLKKSATREIVGKVKIPKSKKKEKKIASFGGINFLVNSKKVLTPGNIKQETTGKWADHDIIGAKPKSEFQGAGLRQLSFDVVLDARLGVKPHSIIKKMHKMVEDGKIGIFMLGTHKIGKGKWKMEKVSDEFSLIYSAGQLVRATVNVTLSEYF